MNRALGAMLLAVATLAAQTNWCPFKKTEKPPSPPNCVVFVLFDLSGSTSNPELRGRYLDDFRKVLSSMGGGQLLMGDVITENTMATASYPINRSFPVYDPVVENEYTYKEKIRKDGSDVHEKARKLLQEIPAAPRTDLMNAFQLADKIFNGERGRSAGQKVLTVFSDMVEESQYYDFTKENLTKQRTEQIIEKQRKEGRLPNLKGVKVWIAGATAAPQGGLSAHRIYQIQDFWLGYFAACQADLTKERYATTLINFELPCAVEKGK